jgi:flagellar hook-length control protein FliK
LYGCGRPIRREKDIVIGGIGVQAGFTEEASGLQTLRPTQDKGFDQVLKRAAHERPDASAPPKTTAPPKQAGARRTLFEEAEPEPRKAGSGDDAPARTEKVAGPEGKKVPKDKDSTDQASGQQAGQTGQSSQAGQASQTAPRDSVQLRAPTEPPSEEEPASDVPDLGAMLEQAGINPQAAALKGQTEHLSGIGLAAYQASPHGNGEAEVAEQAKGMALQAQPTRAQSVAMAVAAQSAQADELLEKVAPEESVEPSTRRKQMPGLGGLAKLDELAETDTQSAETKDKAENARLALLNSMRQPPAGAHPAYGSAFGKEPLPGLKEIKTSGDAVEGARTSVLQHPKAADPSQMQTTLPNLTAAQRGAFGSVQKPDAGQPPLMERVAQEVRWSIKNDRSEATIRLEPENLGTMRIKIVHSGDVMRIDMTVDSQLARTLVESRLSELQQHLGRQDLGADQFAFNVNVQDGGGSESFKQAAQQARALPYSHIAREFPPPEQYRPAGISRPIWGRAGVGIYA